MSDQPVAEAATYTKKSHTQEPTIHAVRRIRSRDSSKPAATDLSRRPQSHRDQAGDILHFIHSSLPKS
jgi:hypothetical protein